ncbi:MAG: hypothetical protein BA066_06480, partial [Candidatus Korarchaeota archaeon NZ13-K]
MRIRLPLALLLALIAISTLCHELRDGSGTDGECYSLLRDVENTLRRFERVRGNEIAMRQLIDDLKADLEYMKLCRKPELFERFAPEGVRVPLVYVTGQGFNVHPINAMNLATEAILYRGDWEEFRGIMEWMLRYMERKGNASFLNFYFAWERASIPWNSSLSQGVAAGYYAVACVRFGDPRYCEAARSLVNSFLIPQEEGGFVIETAYGPFYLEYSNSPDDLVLNGFMLSLKGLAIYDSLIGDGVSRRVLSEGIRTLRGILPYYERGNWSLYSPKHGRATETYHRLHIRLLYFLGMWLGDGELLGYALRWDRYLTDRSELPRAEREYEFWRDLVSSLTASPRGSHPPEGGGIDRDVVVPAHVEDRPYLTQVY